MDGKPWGSLTETENHFTSPYLLSFDDVEKLSNNFITSPPKSVKAESIVTTEMMPMSYFVTDVLSQHNIQLIQYSKQMQELLDQIQNSYLKTNIELIPPIPSEPLKQPIQLNPSIQLTKKGAQQVLHKSIFQICAHEGFDATSESVISTLVDVTEEMMVKFCNLLKANTDREQLGQSSGFTDPMERTLHDIGLNGVKDLHAFYVNRVRSYNGRLKLQCANLRRLCIQAISQWGRKPNGPSISWEDSEWTEWSGNEAQDPDDTFRRSSKVQTEAIHQLHLEENPTVLAAGLEPGLRMLYTLEQQEASEMSLQNTGAETGGGNNPVSPETASPNIATPFKITKKKRKH